MPFRNGAEIKPEYCEYGWLGSSAASPQIPTSWGLRTRSSHCDPSHPNASHISSSFLTRRGFCATSIGGFITAWSGESALQRATFASDKPLLQRFPTEQQVRQRDANAWKLVDLINAHRQRYGLPKIPLSPRMTAVALLHAKDLEEKLPHKKYGSLHSWSVDPRWSGGAYRADDMTSWRIMWDKPKELTGYKSHGFEICAAKVKSVEQAFQAWTESRLHHDVILNRGVWADPRWKWQALGAVYHKGYACGWFGNQSDREFEV